MATLSDGDESGSDAGDDDGLEAGPSGSRSSPDGSERSSPTPAPTAPTAAPDDAAPAPSILPSSAISWGSEIHATPPTVMPPAVGLTSLDMLSNVAAASATTVSITHTPGAYNVTQQAYNFEGDLVQFQPAWGNATQSLMSADSVYGSSANYSNGDLYPIGGGYDWFDPLLGQITSGPPVVPLVPGASIAPLASTQPLVPAPAAPTAPFVPIAPLAPAQSLVPAASVAPAEPVAAAEPVAPAEPLAAAEPQQTGRPRREHRLPGRYRSGENTDPSVAAAGPARKGTTKCGAATKAAAAGKGNKECDAAMADDVVVEDDTADDTAAGKAKTNKRRATGNASTRKRARR